MADASPRLKDLLDLSPVRNDCFKGRSHDVGGKSVFGGQVLGQALMAAGQTVSDACVHSLHGYFLRAGDMSTPIFFEVERIRDGRHFSARRVQAVQFARPIFSAIISFQRPENGLTHQVKMPKVPPPESLTDQSELNRAWLETNRHRKIPAQLRKALLLNIPIEFRPVTPLDPLLPRKMAPRQAIWFRTLESLAPDQMVHDCALAYASDFNLLTTALLPHRRSVWQTNASIASIDHAIWFHRNARVDDWLLYIMDSPSTQSARGLSRGLIFTRSGELAASVTQESLMRIHPSTDGQADA